MTEKIGVQNSARGKSQIVNVGTEVNNKVAKIDCSASPAIRKYDLISATLWLTNERQRFKYKTIHRTGFPFFSFSPFLHSLLQLLVPTVEWSLLAYSYPSPRLCCQNIFRRSKMLSFVTPISVPPLHSPMAIAIISAPLVAQTHPTCIQRTATYTRTQNAMTTTGHRSSCSRSSYQCSSFCQEFFPV